MKTQQIRRQVGETDYAWAAGIIDGEGWLSLRARISNGAMESSIGVKNTDPRMLIKLSQIYYNTNIPFCVILAKEKNKWKSALTIKVAGNRNCKKLLERIFPYLANKKPQASVFLNYLEYRAGRKQIIGCVRDPNYIPNHKQEAILKFLELMKKVKEIPNASETTRRASRPIEMMI